MPTHYEVLGVPADAPDADVRRAYLAAARREHPDHRGCEPSAARTAEARMQAVNAAWAVLRDPAARARYDAALVDPGGVGPLPVPRRPPPFRPPPPVNLRRSGRVARTVPALLLLGVLAAILVITAYARDERTGGTTAPPSTRPAYPVGSCIAVLAGPTAVVVPCSGPSSGRLVAVVDYPRPCPQGTAAVPLTRQRIALCLSPRAR